MNSFSQENLFKLYNNIKSVKNVVICSHLNPDADAIGSEIAFKNYLSSLSIDAQIINDSPIPYNIKFLDSENQVQTYNTIIHDSIILNADIIFILDLNDIQRIKDMKEIVINSKAKKIVIDHHIEPKQFADFYFIDEQASSTGELIWRILSKDNYKFTKETSISLYAAILTDTGCFRYNRTSPEVHYIIAELIKYGANPTEIYDEIYNKFSFKALKLLGESFANMELFFDNKLCVMTITEKNFTSTGADEEDIENFVEKTLSIDGVKAGILFVEIKNRNEIRISLRSKNEINVREIAAKFGGGGHLQAAGLRMKNFTLENAKKEIINEFKNKFNN